MKKFLLGIGVGLGIAVGSVAIASFTDTQDHGWAQSAIDWAQNAGIIRGNDGQFRPADPVSRAELAVVLKRYDDYLNIDEEIGPEGTFYCEDFGCFGNVELNGYATVEQMIGWEDEVVDYVFFNIADSSDDSIYEFLELNAGNSFVQSNAVGLGCLVGNTIERIVQQGNDNISDLLSNIILSSSEADLVTIKLQKLDLGMDGRGAPNCYSHFDSLEIVSQ